MSHHRNLVITALALSVVGSGSTQARLPASVRCGQAGNRAAAQLSAADQALARGDARRANSLLDEALRLLGDHYANSAMLDDTGMHLVLAQAQQGKGKLKQAAATRRNVLTERLHLCGIDRK